MTIVHIPSSLAGGGAEQMVLQLAKESNASVKTIVISIADVKTLEQKFLDANIEVHFLGVNSFKNRSLISGLKKLHSLVKDKDDVIFHCHMFHAAIFGAYYNVFYKKIPTVFTLHTNKLDSFARRLGLYFTKPFRKADIIFSENASKWYLKKNHVIPNGVDFSMFNPNENRRIDTSSTFKFLFLGRMHEPKNPLYLVKAANLLKTSGLANFEFSIVGDGHMKTELVTMIEKHNLSAHFKFHGFQNNIKPFLDEAHCLLLPSIREGMPIVILEAAAAKLPIITTAVGSIPDFLNSSNAYISDLKYFHENMIDVIHNYSDAKERADKLYHEIKSMFDIKSVYNKHIELYKSLLQ